MWNIGVQLNLGIMLPPALAVLFYDIGVLTGHAKRNWFIGIRTPWTLSSDEVWKKTHLLGGKLFRTAGIIAFLGMFFPAYALYIVLAPVLSAALVSVVYSYIICVFH